MKKEAERVIFSSEFRPCTSFLSDVTNFLKTRGDIEQKTTNALSVCPPQKDR